MLLGVKGYADVLFACEDIHGIDHFSENFGHVHRLGAEGERALFNAGERSEVIQRTLYPVVIAVERADLFAELIVCHVLCNDGYAGCGEFDI